jgi:phage portal protein BeeE
MGWFDRPPRLREASPPQLRETDPFPGVYTGGGLMPSWSQFQSMHALWAKQVPAFTRGLKLITGTVAQLPLTEWHDDRAVPNPWLAQPEADEAAWVTMQRTVEDLVLYGTAYWLITQVRAGRPVAIEHLDYPETHRTERPDPAPDLIGLGDEGPWPVADPRYTQATARTVIEFTGADTISTALALELTTRNQADTPMPSQILKNTSNYEMSPTEITEMLAEYTKARQSSTVAYLNGGVELDTVGWSAQELALEPQRNQSAIQVARLLNLDPSFVGAQVSGTSLTYTNRTSQAQQLISETLNDYIVPIEQRLSMRDVTTGIVRLDTSDFVRGNLSERVAMAAALVPIGVMTIEEARAFLTTSPTNGGAFS